MPTAHRTGVPRVDPLELFYDLVFVVVIERLSARVGSASHVGDYLMVAGLTLAVWLCWINQLLLMNQLPARGWKKVVLVLVAMAALGVIAISLDESGEWEPMLFVIGYVVTRIALWPLWSSTRIRRTRWTPFVFGPVLALLWLATLLLPRSVMVVSWVILVTVEVTILITGLARVVHHAAHLTERTGLFVLILLGDCIAETIMAINPGTPVLGWITAGAVFATTCLIWVAYFVTGPYESKRHAAAASPHYVRDVILVGHLLLVLGLLVLAAGFNAAIDDADRPSASTAVAEVGIASGLVLILSAQALMSRRDGALMRWTVSWLLSISLLAAAPLIFAFHGGNLPPATVAFNALAVQAAAILALSRGRHLSTPESRRPG